MIHETKTAARIVAPERARFHEAMNQYGQSRNHRFFYEEPGGPQGYLVDMPAGNDVRPHFHRVDQFQLFFGVEGATYQRSPIAPGSVVVHYADGYMTYGPFETAQEPLEFFTLRAKEDNFIAYMPEDRDTLVKRGRRNLHGDAVLTDGMGLSDRSVETVQLIDREADGMQAYLIRVGPDAEVTVPVGETNGQYCCVVGGIALHDGSPFGVKSLAWVPRGGLPLSLATGPELGTELLVMDYPYPESVDE